MFIDFIYQFLSILINTDIAEVFSAPLAFMLVAMLLFWLFTLFASASSKRIFLIFICVVVGAFCVFSLAQYYGFIQLPVTFVGGTT